MSSSHSGDAPKSRPGGRPTADRLRINGDRLWQTHLEIAKIGAIPGGGSNRLALTDEDRQARDLFVSWCREAGCSIRIDEMGNVFARRAGSDEQLPAVISGSHLDTQATGGIFDGVYGVLAALEVIRALNDAGVATRHPVEAVVWSNEEGVRFAPAMVGSGVWAGDYKLADAHSRTDADGVTFGQALARIGYLGNVACAPFPIRAAFEAHIEQGPILENAGSTIGVVAAVQGIRWFDIVVDGRSSHAGSTPMELRRDPVIALAAILDALYRLAAEHGPQARVTVGRLNAEPGAYNTVPQRVVASLDLRHPDQATLDQLSAKVADIVTACCTSHGLTGSLRGELEHDPVSFDPVCIEAVQEAADRLGYASMPMVSGAAHDMMYVAQHAPAGMIFVPCKGGISHHPEEMATPEDLEAGCNVLLHAILRFAEPI